MSSAVGNLQARSTPYHLSGEIGARNTARYSNVRLYVFAVKSLRLSHLPHEDYSETDETEWHKPLGELLREKILKIADDYPSSIETKDMQLLHVFSTPAKGPEPARACAVVVCRFQQQYPPPNYDWCELSQLTALSTPISVSKSSEMFYMLGAYRRWTERCPVAVRESTGAKLKKKASSVFEPVGKGLKKMGSRIGLGKQSSDDEK